MIIALLHDGVTVDIYDSVDKAQAAADGMREDSPGAFSWREATPREVQHYGQSAAQAEADYKEQEAIYAAYMSTMCGNNGEF
jgi:hypothetical protein